MVGTALGYEDGADGLVMHLMETFEESRTEKLCSETAQSVEYHSLKNPNDFVFVRRFSLFSK